LVEKVKSELFAPELLNEMAKTSGAIKRVRKLDGSALLDTVLFDPDLSYNGISMQLMRRRAIDISRQALHQKYDEQMKAFVKAAFERILTVGLPEEEIQGKEIYIKDSTKFGLPDSMMELFPGTKAKGIKAGVSVQFEFGIKSGASSIKLTAANQNDQGESHLDKESICPGAIYMRDLAYAHMDYMNNIREKEAFFINKLNTRAVIYLKNEEEYKALDLAALQNTVGVFDQQVYIGEDKMPARVIIEQVSAELKAVRIANVEKENKKKGHTTSEYFKLRAGFNFIITNLPADEHKADLIQKLYHLRWQIELVFKAWKSLLKVHHIKKTNVQRVSCMLYAKLLWAILSWKIYTAIGKTGHISILKVYGLIAETKELLREQLLGINTKWLELLAGIPLKRLLKEQKKYRLKAEELIINI
jgi:hypothetical protein